VLTNIEKNYNHSKENLKKLIHVFFSMNVANVFHHLDYVFRLLTLSVDVNIGRCISPYFLNSFSKIFSEIKKTTKYIQRKLPRAHHLLQQSPAKVLQLKNNVPWLTETCFSTIDRSKV